MGLLDYCKGLRCYGVYQFEKFPEWDILCADLEENLNGNNVIMGFAFTKSGMFETGVMLKLPMKGREVGYIYTPNERYSLMLDFHNRTTQ